MTDISQLAQKARRYIYFSLYRSRIGTGPKEQTLRPRHPKSQARSYGEFSLTVAMLAPVAVIQHWKQPGRRGFTWLTDPSTGKASEDSRAGTEGRPQKAAAYWVVSESLSYTSSQDLHRVIPPQQAGTLYIYQQSRKLLTCQSNGGGSVTEIPSSQISLALCQADKNKLTSRNLYFLTTHFFTGHLYNA